MITPSPKGMRVQPQTEDFGIYADVPFLFHLSQRLNIGIWLIMANPIMQVVWDIAFGILLIAIVSAEVRQASSSRALSLFLFVLLGLAFSVAGWLMVRRGLPIIERAISGRPLFGQLGGPRVAAIRALARASRELHVEFSPDDQETLKSLIEVDIKYLDLLTEKRFIDLHPGSSPNDPDVARKWRELWDEKLMKITVEGMTLQELFATGAFSLIFPKMLAARSLFGMVYKIYLGIVLFLGYQALHDHTRLLLLFQVSLVLSLIISACLYLNYSALFNEMTIRWLGPDRPASLAPVIDSLEGRVIRPKTLRHDDGYIAALRGAFARGLGAVMGWNALLTLFLIALTLTVGLITLPASRAHLISSSVSLAIVVLLIPIGLLIGHYLMFFLLQNLHRVAATAAGGAVAALLPPAVAYLVTGRLSKDATVLISAAVSGAAGAIALWISSQLKRATAK